MKFIFGVVFFIFVVFFVLPAMAQPVTAPPLVTATATVLSRMTMAEYVAIRKDATARLATGDGKLAYWLDFAIASGTINVKGLTSQDIKTFLVNAGLLTSARANVIFAE